MAKKQPKKGNYAQAMARLSSKGRMKELFSKENRERSRIRDFLSTGCRRLDYVLGGHGFPWGRIVTIKGPTSQGKTAQALMTAREAQQIVINGDPGLVAFFETEGAFNEFHAHEIGVDLTPVEEGGSFDLNFPDTMEECFEGMYTVLKAIKQSDNPDRFVLIVWDSVAATPTESEVGDMRLEDETGDGPSWTGGALGNQARVMSTNLRKFSNFIKGMNVVVLMVNQVRAKIDVRFGSVGESDPAGNALRFYSSQVLRVESNTSLYRTVAEKKLKQRDPLKKPIGHDLSIRVEKNKVGAPYRVARVPFYFAGENPGIDDLEANLWFLEDEQIVTKVSRTQKFTLEQDGYEWEFIGTKGFKKLWHDGPDFQKAVIDLMKGRLDYKSKEDLIHGEKKGPRPEEEPDPEPEEAPKKAVRRRNR